jgi:hypothetical protein
MGAQDTDQTQGSEDASVATGDIEIVAGGGCMVFIDSVGCSNNGGGGGNGGGGNGGGSGSGHGKGHNG